VNINKSTLDSIIGIEEPFNAQGVSQLNRSWQGIMNQMK
jgi:hypothetical protein